MYIIPKPQEWRDTNATFIIRNTTEILIDEKCEIEAFQYAKILKKHIQEQTGVSPLIRKGTFYEDTIYLKEDSSLQRSYTIDIIAECIYITGSDKEFLLYGIQTLCQMITQEGLMIPGTVIRDYPQIENRGFYHDVTRGRVPTLKSLKKLVDKMSYYKLNQLQLYIEHTYLFRGLSEIWRDDTPLLPEEIMELDAYCRERNIELIPSLASFGHMYKILSTRTYADLCEMENSDKASFSIIDRMAHHTIDVNREESFLFVKKLINEFMPLFTSKYFNICADETFDLGRGRNKEYAGKENGVKELYMSYVKKLCEYVVEKEHVPMFWGDIISRFPEAIKELPRETICLNWGYAPMQTADDTQALAKAGATQYVCPGVTGWNQLINRMEDSYENITRMCRYANEYDAIGVLNTDWGDLGHVNNPEFSTVGLIYGAAFSWNNQQEKREEINRQISQLEYGDTTETFVALISEASALTAFPWYAIVNYREKTMKGMAKEELQTYFKEQPVEKATTYNKRLKEIEEELYRHLKEMKTDRREVMIPYLNAIQGIRCWNIIGATIDSFYYKGANRAAMLPEDAAQALEWYFQQYKEMWRKVSKESELVRIQEIICWYADFVRKFD